jgi:hypothetical protein
LRHTLWSYQRRFHEVKITLRATLLSVVVLCATSAHASTIYNFTASGSGITSSGTITVTQVGSVYEITGISGTYADIVGSAFSGQITGLLPSSYSVTAPSSIQTGVGELLFDNVFYPTGSAPVCAEGAAQSGQALDSCGLAFTVSANSKTYDANFFGYTETAKYAAADFLEGASAVNQTYVPVAISFTPQVVTPEPATWFLTGTGMLAALSAARRRLHRA